MVIVLERRDSLPVSLHPCTVVLECIRVDTARQAAFQDSVVWYMCHTMTAIGLIELCGLRLLQW